MATDFKIYILLKSDTLATQNVDQKLHNTKIWHKFQGERYLFMVCSGILDTIPDLFSVDDLFIRNNKEDFIDAAIDASTSSYIWGVYAEYERLAAWNGLYGVLKEHNQSRNEVRKKFLKLLRGQLVCIQKMVNELYCQEEIKGLIWGLYHLGDEFRDILSSIELQSDQNPKILRSLMFHHTMINSKRDGINQLLWKATCTEDLNYFHVVYDSLNYLQLTTKAQIRLLDTGIQHINEELSETSTLVGCDYYPPLVDQVTDNMNDFPKGDPLDVE
ncbi:LOW QUALITY PROTEIN: hypothetical protein TESG_08165 [Trichophyton tonsurans CBS 112818]|uniref:Uncharacterized protein n=1 Tax=Trichophyton tonsurans (strain CBS 112818) TaxID=647933 RepID=F2SBB4_TRIT1|nr:LOW QUALITY PROTEIN: hypothetical protein TESG_08165 [Trichophyton tonsurans CBS 112818]